MVSFATTPDQSTPNVHIATSNGTSRASPSLSRRRSSLLHMDGPFSSIEPVISNSDSPFTPTTSTTTHFALTTEITDIRNLEININSRESSSPIEVDRGWAIPNPISNDSTNGEISNNVVSMVNRTYQLSSCECCRDIGSFPDLAEWEGLQELFRIEQGRGKENEKMTSKDKDLQNNSPIIKEFPSPSIEFQQKNDSSFNRNSNPSPNPSHHSPSKPSTTPPSMSMSNNEESGDDEFARRRNRRHRLQALRFIFTQLWGEFSNEKLNGASQNDFLQTEEDPDTGGIWDWVPSFFS